MCVVIWVIVLLLLFCLLPCLLGFICYRCGCTQCTELVQWYKRVSADVYLFIITMLWCFQLV